MKRRCKALTKIMQKNRVIKNDIYIAEKLGKQKIVIPYHNSKVFDIEN